MNIIPFEPGMIPEAGKCYSGMSNDDYHHKFIDWYSSSDLKNGLRSAEYFWQEYTRKKKQKEKEYKLAFENGSAFHDALESLIVHDDLSLFENNTVSFDGKVMSKKFMDKKEEFPGKTVITEEMLENVPIMAEKTKKIADKLEIFKGGDVELAFFWNDPETGAQLKVKTDYTRFDINVIVDFKTTKNHQEKDFSKDMANFLYHFSAAMYIEGIKQVMGIDIDEFIIIAVNNTKPFEVEFYPMNELTLKEGVFLFRSVLDNLNAPSNNPEFKKIGVPMWALTHLDKAY